jgi:hypothetical protein
MNTEYMNIQAETILRNIRDEFISCNNFQFKEIVWPVDSKSLFLGRIRFTAYGIEHFVGIENINNKIKTSFYSMKDSAFTQIDKVYSESVLMSLNLFFLRLRFFNKI